jgi:hypothetical protein
MRGWFGLGDFLVVEKKSLAPVATVIMIEFATVI